MVGGAGAALSALGLIAVVGGAFGQGRPAGRIGSAIAGLAAGRLRRG